MGRRKLDYFMCEICGLTEKDFQGKFARKNYLEHLNSKVHVNQKFTCDQCDQEFQHKKGQEGHAPIYTDKRLTQSNYHVKDIHSDIHGEKLHNGINHLNSYNLC